tara:strand:- start:65 stop:430 length:366 start_codon:yes stop_codon:yes gene_type:complete
MDKLDEFIENSDLSLKDEICFSIVIHTTMTSIVLNHSLDECREFAINQASLLKVMQDNLCEHALNELWIRDEKGFEIHEFVENAIELYAWVRLVVDHNQDDEFTDYINAVHLYMSKESSKR